MEEAEEIKSPSNEHLAAVEKQEAVERCSMMKEDTSSTLVAPGVQLSEEMEVSNQDASVESNLGSPYSSAQFPPRMVIRCRKFKSGKTS
jgi:hypothetical protein